MNYYLHTMCSELGIRYSKELAVFMEFTFCGMISEAKTLSFLSNLSLYTLYSSPQNLTFMPKK